MPGNTGRPESGININVSGRVCSAGTIEMIFSSLLSVITSNIIKLMMFDK